MKSKLILLISLFALAMNYSNAQSPIKPENLPFDDITEYPDTYAPGSVAARMVESLGFRYRYASQDLKTSDFGFKAEEEARTIGETIEHIYGLSMVIRNAVIQEPYKKITSTDPMVIRAETLHVLKATYDHLIGMDEAELNKITIKESYPFWVVINGPLADALWHSGQIATLRRANGNPMPKGVNVFLGKYEEVK